LNVIPGTSMEQYNYKILDNQRTTNEPTNQPTITLHFVGEKFQ